MFTNAPSINIKRLVKVHLREGIKPKIVLKIKNKRCNQKIFYEAVK